MNSFQTEDYIAFACGDGVLAIEQQNTVFTAQKIANPAEIADGSRIGTLKGSEESNVMIGIAGANFFLVDLATQNIAPFEWQQEAESLSVTYGFDGHNEHLLILDNDGHLNVYSAESDWQFEMAIEVFEPLSNDEKPMIVASKAHEVVYIINGQEVTAVDLHDGEVTGHFDLDFVPGNAAWLGVAEEEHDH